MIIYFWLPYSHYSAQHSSSYRAIALDNHGCFESRERKLLPVNRVKSEQQLNKNTTFNGFLGKLSCPTMCHSTYHIFDFTLQYIAGKQRENASNACLLPNTFIYTETNTFIQHSSQAKVIETFYGLCMRKSVTKTTKRFEDFIKKYRLCTFWSLFFASKLFCAFLHAKLIIIACNSLRIWKAAALKKYIL